MWAGRHVVVGVSGGIAAYKSCHLVRRLSESGARVDVVLTAAAAEFVRPLTFEALSVRPVLTSLWEPDRALAHVHMAREADLVIVAPATAHLLARVAHGLADDLLTALLLARTGPVLFAPAMNDAMYAAPPTRQNLALLRERGFAFVGPEIGALAEGRGVVTAGPTGEPLDPVRLVTNRSSGKMGFRLAQAAWYRGALVRLITGPSAEPEPVGVTLTRIETTKELEESVREALPVADVLIMAAAPADFRPADASATKRPREGGRLTIELCPTVDILTGTAELRKPDSVTVGFALETGDAEAKARAKLARKGLDLIVVNDALEAGAGFEVNTNRVTVLDRDGGRWELPLASKAEVAESILDRVEARLG